MIEKKNCDYFIHETSLINKNVSIGNDTKIWQFCVVLDGVHIGSNCNIGHNVYIESKVKLGNDVTIKNNVSLYTGIICEDKTFLGPNCVFTNVMTPRSFVSRKNEFKNTIIKRGATIGANATILCGHEIGEYAMIGAGAVVTHDVPAYTLVVGNPSKKLGYVCQCGDKINLNSYKECQCKRCSLKYVERTGILFLMP